MTDAITKPGQLWHISPGGRSIHVQCAQGSKPEVARFNTERDAAAAVQAFNAFQRIAEAYEDVGLLDSRDFGAAVHLIMKGAGR